MTEEHLHYSWERERDGNSSWEELLSTLNFSCLLSGESGGFNIATRRRTLSTSEFICHSYSKLNREHTLDVQKHFPLARLHNRYWNVTNDAEIQHTNCKFHTKQLQESFHSFSRVFYCVFQVVRWVCFVRRQSESWKLVFLVIVGKIAVFWCWELSPNTHTHHGCSS